MSTTRDTTHAAPPVVDRPHLTQDPPSNGSHGVSKPSEAYCRDCRCRITITPEGLEVGHRTKHTGRHERCPHRPDEGVDPTTDCDTGRYA